MNYIQKSTIGELKHMISSENGSAFGQQCAGELATRRRAIRKVIINSLPNLAAGALLTFIASMCVFDVVQLSISILKHTH